MIVSKRLAAEFPVTLWLFRVVPLIGAALAWLLFPKFEE
jgi:hypothetical protein